MSDASFLVLDKLTLAYGKTPAVSGLDLHIRRGELIALLGPSGCGKTTTMRAIAGLMPVKSGQIRLDERDITHTPANKREVGLVFQSYALFPHLTVYENVAFGLRLKGVSGTELDARVTGAIKSVGLAKFASRKTPELSGGQQQRVALARSMVMEPKVLMLDEPLSNLDARLRLEMRNELQRMQKESGVTMIFVTHDQVEALALADRIVVMRDGAIEQIGTPEDIYNRPASNFVADFVGFENIFAVKDGRMITQGGDISLSADAAGAAGLAWRPDAVPLGAGPYSGTVRGTSFAGSTREYVLDTPLGPIKTEVDAGKPAHQLGDAVRFDLPLDAAAPSIVSDSIMGVWIDTDMGFDDIAAVLVVQNAGLAIDGVSLTFGNAPLAQVCRNAAGAAAAFGWRFPIHMGRALPVMGRLETAQTILGETGIPTRGRTLPEAEPLPVSDAFAALCRWLEGDGPHRILALGPLGNLAALALARPDLASRIDDLVWMGGGLTRGNHTASAEFNAFADPEAAAIVLAQGLPLTMVDLDFCRRILATPQDVEALRRAQGINAELLADLFGGFVDIALSRARPAMALYDPAAAVVFARPDLITFEPARIDVECGGHLTRGRTVVETRASHAIFNARFAADCDRTQVREAVLAALHWEAGK